MRALLPKRRRKSDIDLSQLDYALAPKVKTSVSEAGFVILNVTTGNVYLCSGVAATMWGQIAAGESLQNIVDSLSREYCVTSEQAGKDLRAFLGDLLRRGIIIRKRLQAVRTRHSFLFAAALWELLCYDVRLFTFGFRSVHDVLMALPGSAKPRTAALDDLTRRILRAVSLASSFYWRPVHCLQWSVIATRLLRAAGVPAEFVIGYRAAPFFSHAWVEVDGRVVNDAAGLPRNLTVLHRV